MRAMVLSKTSPIENRPLEAADLPIPEPSNNQILVKISVCGVCHTELDEIEGRALPSILPVIPGHQVVGRIAGKGKNTCRMRNESRLFLPIAPL